MLRLDGIGFRYPGATHDSLHGVSLALVPGTVMGLVGAAESGKSTLCLVAGGLAPRVVGGRLTGEVSVDGMAIRGWPMHRVSEHVVTGLQDPAGQLSLVADTVLDEVAFGPANMGLPRDEVLARAEASLSLLGIDSLALRDPRRLSGGQTQLLVMAGLLAMRPRYLVLDAPLAHLDARGSGLVLDAVARVAATGTGVLIAEQRVDAIEAACDTLLVMAHGNVVLEGPPATILADPILDELGIERTRQRLWQALAAAGVDPGLTSARP